MLTPPPSWLKILFKVLETSLEPISTPGSFPGANSGIGLDTESSWQLTKRGFIPSPHEEAVVNGSKKFGPFSFGQHDSNSYPSPYTNWPSGLSATLAMESAIQTVFLDSM